MTANNAIASSIIEVPYKDKDHSYTLKYTTTRQTAELSGISFKYSYEPLTLEIPETITIDGIEYTVTSIADNAVMKDSNFPSGEYMPEKIVLPSTITTIGEGAFKNNTHLKTINCPEKVTKMGQSTFSGCTSLEVVEFPDSLTEIEYRVCYRCASLKTVKIGASVTNIFGYAFTGQNGNDVPQIESIYCDALTPPRLDSRVFDSSCSATVYVPFGTVEAYEESWSQANFTFVEMGEGQTSGVITQPNGKLYSLVIGATRIQLSSKAGAIYTLDGKKVVDINDQTDSYNIPSGVYLIKTMADVVKIVVR